MKKNILIICFLVVTFNCFSQNLNYQWTKTIGGVGNDVATCVISDNSGNIYVAGNFNDSIDFDPGAGTSFSGKPTRPGAFFQKFDTLGNLIWVKTIFGRPIDVNSICVDSDDNLYATGKFYGPNQPLGQTDSIDFDPGPDTLHLPDGTGYDIYVLKLDKHGNLKWAHTIYGAEIFPGEIVADEEDNIVLCGELKGTFDFDFGAGIFELTGTGSKNIFMMKMDSLSNFIWAKAFHNIGWGESYTLTTDMWNNIYFSANTTLIIDLDPGAGVFNLASSGGFLSKFDDNGDFLWAHHIAESYGKTNELFTDTAGNVYAAGHWTAPTMIDFDPGSGTSWASQTLLTSKVYIVKFDTAGTFQWVHYTIGGGTSSAHTLESASYSEVNNSIVMGINYEQSLYTGIPPGYQYPNGAEDIALLEIDPMTGFANYVDAKFYGGLSTEIVNGVTTDPFGNIYTCGYFKDTTALNPENGSEELISNGLKDVFFQKFSSCYSSYASDTLTACGSYASPSGNYTWTTSGTYADTLMNAIGCDSIITVHLSINYSNTGTDVITACDTYTWIDGNTYTSSNNSATHTLTNAAGCDSVVTLDLIINNSTSSTDTQTACDSYLWIDGNTYTSSNNSATHTLTNAAGCDSVVTLDLTINTVDTAVTQNGATLTANSSGATYLWLDCDNSFIIISGETNQSYTATVDGNYAVEITLNGCVDTSACYSVTGVGIIENNFGDGLLLYPNPSDGNFSIDLGYNFQNVKVSIMDLNGKLIRSVRYYQSQLLNLRLEEPAGVYLLIVESEDKRAAISLVKN